jgi:hypothetical protein
VKRIFVAGGSDELAEVAAAIDALRAAGWEVLGDWPAMREKEPAHPTPAQLYEIGGILENALQSATVLWVLLPRAKSEGAAYELGFFRGLLAAHPNPRKGVVVSGPIDSLGRLYPHRAAAQGRIFSEHIEALEYLIGMV